MQANDLVRSLGRRAWVLALVVLVAAAAGFAIAIRQAADNTSTAVLLIHPETGQFGSSVGYVTAFQAALDSDEVIESVSSTTGVPTADLSRGLQAQPTASNSLSFDVTYTGPQDADTVAKVPPAAAAEVISTLYQPQVAAAQEDVSAQQDAVDQAQAQLDAARTRSGGSPAAQYESLTSQITQLRVSLAQNLASSAPQYSDSELRDAIASARAKARALSARADAFTRLNAEVDRREAALQASTDAQAKLERQSSDETIQSGILAGSASSVSRLSSAIQAGVAAGLVALVFGLLVIAALRSRSRAHARDEQAFVRPGLSPSK